MTADDPPRFDELAAGENVVYVLETTYDDVRYGTDFFRLDTQTMRIADAYAFDGVSAIQAVGGLLGAES